MEGGKHMPSYTAAEKENALRLCDEIGISQASKETGISRSSLVNWRSGTEEAGAATTPIDETPAEEALADEEDARQIHENVTTRKRYSAEEKENALRLYNEVGVTKASRLTGITINSLRKWRMDAQNTNPATPADGESPVEKKIAEPDDLQAVDGKSSTDILSRLAKIPANETAEEGADAHLSRHNLNVDGGPGEELIRLRIENASLRVQMAALKTALRVFTE